MYVGGLECERCGLKLTVYYARDFRRRYPGFRDQDSIVIRGICPRHGKIKQRLNPLNKRDWMDKFAESIFRCTKCFRAGKIEKIRKHKHWRFFNINCPIHGLTDTKKVVASLLNPVIELQKLGITYAEYMQTQGPTTFIICPKCRHIVAPGSKFCEICGTSFVPKEFDQPSNNNYPFY